MFKLGSATACGLNSTLHSWASPEKYFCRPIFHPAHGFYHLLNSEKLKVREIHGMGYSVSVVHILVGNYTF